MQTSCTSAAHTEHSSLNEQACACCTAQHRPAFSSSVPSTQTVEDPRCTRLALLQPPVTRYFSATDTTAQTALAASRLTASSFLWFRLGSSRYSSPTRHFMLPPLLPGSQTVLCCCRRRPPTDLPPCDPAPPLSQSGTAPVSCVSYFSQTFHPLLRCIPSSAY